MKALLFAALVFAALTAHAAQIGDRYAWNDDVAWAYPVTLVAPDGMVGVSTIVIRVGDPIQGQTVPCETCEGGTQPATVQSVDDADALAPVLATERQAWWSSLHPN